MMYKSYLKGSRFQVLPARTTREAEEVLERIKPSAIILDVVLRSEDTWAFMARLKQDESTKDIPVLVASSIEDQAKGFHLGADRYLVKPIERMSLIKELTALTEEPAITRVLIIDDEERDRYLVKQKLRDMSLLIAEAENGAEGLRMAHKNKPDLIFLDVRMPGMTGFEVVERLKKESSLAEIPVILVTSHVLTETEQRAMAQKVVAIVGKGNLAETDFAELVRRAVNERKLSLGAA
jgi:CheY-like chemotaxis protein